MRKTLQPCNGVAPSSARAALRASCTCWWPWFYSCPGVIPAGPDCCHSRRLRRHRSSGVKPFPPGEGQPIKSPSLTLSPFSRITAKSPTAKAAVATAGVPGKTIRGHSSGAD
uniref:(northern house mosquito) hypothetical protein n=1 Tax=Culex pipiens TaxID=7175 RepID=A0A8D8FGQ6_CULPI